MAEQLQPKVLRQIMKELKEMSESPPEGITVRPREAPRAPAPPRPCRALTRAVRTCRWSLMRRRSPTCRA